jgi:hypothetical protein
MIPRLGLLDRATGLPVMILGLGLRDRATRLPGSVGLGLLGGATTLSRRIAKEILLVGQGGRKIRYILNKVVSKY